MLKLPLIMYVDEFCSAKKCINRSCVHLPNHRSNSVLLWCNWTSNIYVDISWLKQIKLWHHRTSIELRKQHISYQISFLSTFLNFCQAQPKPSPSSSLASFDPAIPTTEHVQPATYPAQPLTLKVNFPAFFTESWPSNHLEYIRVYRIFRCSNIFEYRMTIKFIFKNSCTIFTSRIYLNISS